MQNDMSCDNEGICTTGFSVSHSLVEEGHCPSRANRHDLSHTHILLRPLNTSLYSYSHLVSLEGDSPLQFGILLLPLGSHSLCSFSVCVSNGSTYDLTATSPVWRVKESSTIFS